MMDLKTQKILVGAVAVAAAIAGSLIFGASYPYVAVVFGFLIFVGSHLDETVPKLVGWKYLLLSIVLLATGLILAFVHQQDFFDFISNDEVFWWWRAIPLGGISFGVCGICELLLGLVKPDRVLN